MAVEYKKEFFDKTYTVREAYARVWKYARRYKFRLFLGVVCGMLTAGTLVPFFQIVQPTLQHVESHDAGMAQKSAATDTKVSEAPSVEKKQPQNVFEKQIAKNSKLPAWYPKVEKFAAKFGIRLQNEKGGMGGALLLIVCIVVPLVALARLALMYLNHYCLSWAGAHAVADIRQELLEHVQKQNLQFFGRVDVGQLMTRISGDPQQIQVILSTILSEVAMAPFEIFVAFGFIIWFAIANNMLATLLLIAIGFPLFVLPIQMIGKRVKKWARRTMERGSMIGAKIHEILTCIKVVKSYNTEEYENKRYSETNKYLLKSTMRGLRVGLMVGPTVETIGIILICAFLVWCFATNVKISDVVPMLAPLLIIYKPVKQLSKLQVQIETSMAALSRIYSVLDLEMELSEKADAASKKSFDDKIIFDDVSFKYDTAESDAVKHARFELPRGKMVAVVGGTGSGKSTLLSDIFYPVVSNKLMRTSFKPGLHDKILGIENIDKVINIDQSPIGRTPRSNPVTYVGVFDAIRELFSSLPDSKAKGYTPGRFSFNVKGGRCEKCQGAGTLTIEMNFLPDVFIQCDVCHGQRFNSETLDVRYHGKNISDVLNMTIEEAADFFAAIPHISRKLETLKNVGLGYIQLGQSALTLSGGEAQRVKLATELARPSTGKTLYILDEPTTGLHFADVKVLMEVIQKLVDKGNSVVMIEHNLDVIAQADWIIDLGPEGGTGGGQIVDYGTPEHIVANWKKTGSWTGKYLEETLNAAHKN